MLFTTEENSLFSPSNPEQQKILFGEGTPQERMRQFETIVLDTLNKGVALPDALRLSYAENKYVQEAYMTYSALSTGLLQQERYFDRATAYANGDLPIGSDTSSLFLNPDGSLNPLLTSINQTDPQHPIYTLTFPNDATPRYYQLVHSTAPDLNQTDHRGLTDWSTETGYKAAAFREVGADGAPLVDAPIIVLHGGARFPPTDLHHRADWEAVSRLITSLANKQMGETRLFLDDLSRELHTLDGDRNTPHEVTFLGHSLGASNNLAAAAVLLERGDALNMNLHQVINIDGLAGNAGAKIVANAWATHLDETQPNPDGTPHDALPVLQTLYAKTLSLTVEPPTLATEFAPFLNLSPEYQGAFGKNVALVIPAALKDMDEKGLLDYQVLGPRNAGKILGNSVQHLETHNPTLIANHMLATAEGAPPADLRVWALRAAETDPATLLDREEPSFTGRVFGFGQNVVKTLASWLPESWRESPGFPLQEPSLDEQLFADDVVAYRQANPDFRQVQVAQSVSPKTSPTTLAQQVSPSSSKIVTFIADKNCDPPIALTEETIRQIQQSINWRDFPSLTDHFVDPNWNLPQNKAAQGCGRNT